MLQALQSAISAQMAVSLRCAMACLQLLCRAAGQAECAVSEGPKVPPPVLCGHWPTSPDSAAIAELQALQSALSAEELKAKGEQLQKQLADKQATLPTSPARARNGVIVVTGRACSAKVMVPKCWTVASMPATASADARSVTLASTRV